MKIEAKHREKDGDAKELGGYDVDLSLRAKRGEIRREQKSVTISEVFFYLFFFAIFGVRSFGFYDGQKVFNVALALGATFFALKLLSTKHTLPEYLGITFFLTLGTLVYWKSGEKGILLCFTMMLGMKGVPLRRIMMLCAGVLGTGMFYLTFTSVFCLRSEMFFLTGGRFGMQTMIRHCLGYPQVSTLMTVFIVMMLLIIYLTDEYHPKQIKAASGLLLIALLYYYLYSAGFTGLIGGIFALVINSCFTQTKKWGRLERVIILAAYPLMLLISVGSPLVFKLKSMSGSFPSVRDRLRLAYYYFQNNPPVLFGNRLRNPQHEAYSVDIAHFYLLIGCGIVTFAVIGILQEINIYYQLKRKRAGALTMSLTLLFCGMTEPFLYNLSFRNLTFLLIGAWWYEWMEIRFGTGRGYRLIRKKVFHLPCKEGSFLGTLKILKEKKSLCTMVGITICAIFLYALMSGVPRYLYVPPQGYSMFWEDGTLDSNIDPDDALYLSKTEVKEIKHQHDMVLYYYGEHVPMFRYEGGVVLLEYIRRLISIGVFSMLGSGCICFVIAKGTEEKSEL